MDQTDNFLQFFWSFFWYKYSTDSTFMCEEIFYGPPSDTDTCRHMKCLHFLFLGRFIRPICVNEKYSNVNQLSVYIMFLAGC